MAAVQGHNTVVGGMKCGGRRGAPVCTLVKVVVLMLVFVLVLMFVLMFVSMCIDGRFVYRQAAILRACLLGVVRLCCKRTGFYLTYTCTHTHTHKHTDTHTYNLCTGSGIPIPYLHDGRDVCFDAARALLVAVHTQ